jgi:hypothetical protein
MGQGIAGPPTKAGNFETAWRELRADDQIQFAPVDIPEADPPPDWLAEFLNWLGELLAPLIQLLVNSWPVLMWVLIALAVLGLGWFLYGMFGPGFKRRKGGKGEREDWVPAEREALALLEEADRLAEAGDYDEATHLLLKRSVWQIAEARPDLVEPSSTARELASDPRLPEAARTAFGLIAAPVERSLFALSKLDQADWQAARAAYADFALAQKAIAA